MSKFNSIERISLFSPIHFSKYIERMPNVTVQNSKQIIVNSSTTSLFFNAPKYLVGCIIQKRLATLGTKNVHSSHFLTNVMIFFPGLCWNELNWLISAGNFGKSVFFYWLLQLHSLRFIPACHIFWKWRLQLH